MRYLPELQCQGLPRWVHRDLPRARSARLARVAPRARGSLLCTTWTSNLGTESRGSHVQPGVQFSLSKGVRFRTSLDKGRTGSVDDRLGMPVRRVSQWCRRGSRPAAAKLHSPHHRRRRDCRRDFGQAVRRAVNSPLRTLRCRCCRQLERRRGAGREASGAWRISVIWLDHARALCEQLNSPEGTRVDPGVPCR
jgi:hypothetical protein